MKRPIDIAVDAVRCAEFSRSPSAIMVARRIVATATKTAPVLDLVARLDRIIPRTPEEERQGKVATSILLSLPGLTP